MQEKFRAGIHKFATVVTGCQRMVRAAQELKIPVIATEQYPKGLGHTVEEIDTSHELTTVVAKTDFSMIVPEVVAKLEDAVKKVVESADFKERSAKLGFEPAFLPASEFGKVIANDDASISKLMDQLGLKKKK